MKHEVADNQEFIFRVADGVRVSFSSFQFHFFFARNSPEMKYDVKERSTAN